MRPTGVHTDWPWPFNKISRRLTSADGFPPQMRWGNSVLTYDPTYRTLYPKPIPRRGEWWIGGPRKWPLYIAVTHRNGWHFRIGVRWDDLGFYYTWPSFTYKKIV